MTGQDCIHIESPEEVEIRESEDDLVNSLVSAGISKDKLFRKIRIPNEVKPTAKKLEIDIVVLNDDGIHCIEICNIEGYISYCNDGKSWEQHKTINGSTHVTQHSNPVKSIKYKANMLRNHLLQLGVSLKENYFFAEVVLMKKCRFDDVIEGDPNVITRINLPNKFKKTWFTWIINPLIPSVISGMLSYFQIPKTQKALSQIGTWDILELGRLPLKGDFLGKIDRNEVEEMIFEQSGSWSKPRVKVTYYKRKTSWWFGRTEVRNEEISLNKNFEFQIDGESDVNKFEAKKIKRIILSV